MSAWCILTGPWKPGEDLLQHPLLLVFGSWVRRALVLLGLTSGMCEPGTDFSAILRISLLTSPLTEARMKQFVSSGVSSLIKAWIDLFCILLSVHRSHTCQAQGISRCPSLGLLTITTPSLSAHSSKLLSPLLAWRQEELETPFIIFAYCADFGSGGNLSTRTLFPVVD